MDRKSTSPLPLNAATSARLARQARAATKPELALRRELHRRGLRYRVNHPTLPGRPDIAFTRVKIAVFVDGCFWHGCHEHGRSSFNHNADYWPAKIAANVARDADTTEQLRQAGWLVLRFWEHEDAAEVVENIRRAVRANAGSRYANEEK